MVQLGAKKFQYVQISGVTIATNVTRLGYNYTVRVDIRNSKFKNFL